MITRKGLRVRTKRSNEVEFSLDEIREINFAVSCHLQDKENIRPTAKKHLESIFSKTANTLRDDYLLRYPGGM